MVHHVKSIVTKGILGNGVSLATKGIILIEIEQGLIRELSGGWAPPEPKKRFYVKVTFRYNDNIYSDIKYHNKDIRIGLDDINIDIIDSKPKVRIDLLNDE